MRSSDKLSKNTSRGLLFQLSQAKSLIRALSTQSDSQKSNDSQTRIKQILLSKITPFIENQTLIPGLPTALATVLKQVSDDDIVRFLLEFEALLGETIDEIGIVDSTADLDMQDKIPQLVN